jgi:hypothetical protein
MCRPFAPRSLLCIQGGGIQKETEMLSLPAPDYRKAQQHLADMNEELELKRWGTSHPTWIAMLRTVDEAARRAAALARLEDAITHLR